jgi:hypothetical protein
MTTEKIHNCTSDDELFEYISSEMSELMGDTGVDDIEMYLKKIRSLPKLYWAFGAIYALDVSLALDDLGWHFGNHYSLALAHETVRALQEVGAVEEATIFEEAIHITAPYWNELGTIVASNAENAFAEWYESSGLEGKLEKLNIKMWAITTEKEKSLLDYIPKYARAYPEHAIIHHVTSA